jgi:hypothetical protein
LSILGLRLTLAVLLAALGIPALETLITLTAWVGEGQQAFNAVVPTPKLFPNSLIAIAPEIWY